MIAFAEVSIGKGGVLSCAKCGAPPVCVPFPLAEVAERLRSHAREWRFGPGPNVCLVGFEPFAHPELPALIAAAAAEGFERIRLRTDGGALAVAGNAPGVIGAGVRQLEVVALGPDADSHDALASRAGLFAAMTAGLEAFEQAAATAGCETFVCGRIPVCAHNIGHLPATVAMLAERGAGAVTIDASGRSLGRQGAQLVEAAIDTATVNSMAVHLIGFAASEPWPAPWTVIGDD